MLIRSRHAASLARSNLRSLTTPSTRSTASLARRNGTRSETCRNLTPRTPVTLDLAIRKPLSTSLQRYQTHTTTASPFDHIDKKEEKAAAKEKLEVNPEDVSETSSVHELFHEKGVEDPEREEDMLAGVKQDLVGLIAPIGCLLLK